MLFHLILFAFEFQNDPSNALDVAKVKKPQSEGTILGSSGNVKIEGNFGSSIYNYDLLFPKFRSLVSMISLSYSSSNGNTEMGQGWNLHIPYIQREIHKGIPTKNTAIEHSADGSLITQNNIDFRPRNSGSFAIYKLESDNSFLP